MEVNETQPSLIGHSCDDLIVEEYWHEGVLDDPASVIWLRVDSAWHRLYFDGGIVFWRTHDDDGPQAYEMPELESQVRLKHLGRSLGIRGRVFADVSTRFVDGVSEVEFRWDSGEPLVIRNFEDRTTFHSG